MIAYYYTTMSISLTKRDFMKKLLFICLVCLIGINSSVWAAVREVSSPESATIETNNRPAPPVTLASPLDRFQTESDFKRYLVERLKSVAITKYDKNSGSFGGSATSVVEDKIPGVNVEKPFFDRIYEEAIKRSAEPQNTTTSSNQLHPSMLQPELFEQEAETQNPLQAITILMPPFDEKVSVPLFEHIPYLFTRIDVLPDGVLKFEETIMVVADNQKLRYPLIKALPTHMVDRDGNGHKIEPLLIGVTINDQPVDYHILEKGGNILIAPKTVFPLESGVYKYVFNYAIDRQLARYDNFDELQWDVSGGNWNLVIAQAGAAVILPPNSEPISQQALVGYPFHYSPEKAIMARGAPNMLGFASKEPLFIAESMPITVTIPKGVVSDPSFSKQLNWFITDNGKVLFLLLGWLAIFLAYAASWKYIQKTSKKQPIKLIKTPQMMRYLLNGKFDKVSFGAFLLDLFRKNIIDIQKNGDNILLVKRTDNLRTLPKKEQTAVRNMFGNDAVLTINDSSLSKIRKSIKLVEEEVYSKYRIFCLKLNGGYLFFSTAMLLLAQLFTALLSPDSAVIFSGMLFVDFNVAAYLILFALNWKKKAVKWSVKILCVALLGLNFVVWSGLASMWGAIFFMASVITIMSFTKLYTKRNGLLKANIAEAANYQQYLKDNKENISMGRDFLNQQANILALEAETAYPPSEKLKDYYRLDIVQELLKKI